MRSLLIVTLVCSLVCSALMVGAQESKKTLPSNVTKAMREIPDRPYAGTEGPRQRLDLFLPTRPANARLPVIVFIHGGAWRQGDKRVGRKLLQPFVESGAYAGASVNYRLSQMAPWPAQIHDVKAAIRWLRAHADRYGLDSQKIGVWGTSAGGHLAAMLGVSGDLKTLEGQEGTHLDQPSEVTCVANYFGPSALLTMDDHPGAMVHNAPDSPESQLIGGPIQENKERSQEASPVTHVTRADAPFLHVHGDKDPLVPYPQSVHLDAALDRIGVASTLITMEGAGHGRFAHPRLPILLKQFFDHHLLGISPSPAEEVLSPLSTSSKP